MEKHIKARPFDDNSRVNLVVANDTCTDVCRGYYVCTGIWSSYCSYAHWLSSVRRCNSSFRRLAALRLFSVCTCFRCASIVLVLYRLVSFRCLLMCLSCYFKCFFEFSNENYGCFVEIHALFSWASVLFGVSFSDLVWWNLGMVWCVPMLRV